VTRFSNWLWTASKGLENRQTIPNSKKLRSYRISTGSEIWTDSLAWPEAAKENMWT